MPQWNTHHAKFEKLSDLLTDPQKIAAQQTPVNGAISPTLAEIGDWLGRLKLLYGVPFNYLVPYEEMLPEESIRFFYVDSVWLDHLVEGAFSIGRSTASDLAHDTANSAVLHQHAANAARAARQKVALAEAAAGTPITPTEKVTGFLLRSAVVKGWPGMLIKAYQEGDLTTPLKALRMEHLAPNVLLCFFEGIIQELTITEHPEALHFGVDPSNDPPITYSKSYRYLVAYKGNQPGAQIDTKLLPALQMKNYFRSGSKRVLKINDLASMMGSQLKEKVDYTGNFTAAEFALEMIEGVEAVKFVFDDQKGGSQHNGKE
jgi:hypothetical protein